MYFETCDMLKLSQQTKPYRTSFSMIIDLSALTARMGRGKVLRPILLAGFVRLVAQTSESARRLCLRKLPTSPSSGPPCVYHLENSNLSIRPFLRGEGKGGKEGLTNIQILDVALIG